MKYIRLGDVATYINGYAFKPEDRGDSGLPIIRIQDLTGNTYDLGYYDGKYPERIEINNGDILISWSASLGVYVWTRGKALLNQHIFKVVFDKKPINKQFFIFAVENNLHLMESKTHGATMKHIIKKDFDNTLIPYPSLERQREIADSLSKVKTIINARENELQALDDLIKARFVELFGVCDTYELLEDSNIYISDGNYSSKYPTADEFVQEGIPFIRASNMEMNTIVDSNMYFITKEKHAILLKGHVKAGDVLITTRGATIGKIACVPPRHEGSNINAQIVLLRCPKNEYNPLFLSWYLKLDNTQVEIQKLISGSAQPQLPIKRLVQLKLLKPDINLQNQFAAFVEQTDKSKFIVQQALDEAQLLFDSLMQQYFG